VLTGVAEGGVALAGLAQAELRPRSGGEDFQCGPARPPRSLKKQWQAAGVPAWSRDGPLLWAGGRLVYVPGLGVDARAVAAPGSPQVAIAWEPDRPK
jgi:tRNA(Ile)-lysidine synthase